MIVLYLRLKFIKMIFFEKIQKKYLQQTKNINQVCVVF